MFDLKQDIRCLKGVGEKRAVNFKSAGIDTVEDLLYYFPRDWKDFSNIKKIKDIEIGEEVTIHVKNVDIKTLYTRRRGFTITKGLFSDGTGEIGAVWFNQSFITRFIKEDTDLYLAGVVDEDKGLIIKNPAYEIIGKNESKHLARIVPVYRELKNVSSKMLRYIIKLVIDNFEIEEFLPKELIKREGFIALQKAIKNIHFPRSFKDLRESKLRLGFDELFIPQVLSQLVRRELRQEKSFPVREDKKFLKKLLSSIKFKLTDSQKNALREITEDIGKGYPMNRLLEGDVGSGKTLVSAISLAGVVNAGFQGALMVPTEVLAWEHYENIKRVFRGYSINVALLTGSTKKAEKEKIYKSIKDGKISVIVGTHSLLNEKVEFKNLALAVIDEQHRFGVRQRKSLRGKNNSVMPHLLSMTATPIPRTYSLTVYGDLDISVLTDMPQGERKTKTYLVPQKKRDGAYEFIKKNIDKGSRAIVICPSILESDKLAVKAVEKEFEILRGGEFSGYIIDMLHGKMTAQEKKEKIELFKKGKTQIMISTTVIEVGLNIPKLSVMMVENAERFGLAQLHQLRGRIGRAGEEASFLMFTSSKNSETIHRLKEMVKVSDGFRLSEIDFELRGQGDIFGVKQSGMPDFRLTSFSDFELLKRAHNEAVSIVSKDPALANSLPLKRKVGNIYKGVHAE